MKQNQPFMLVSKITLMLMYKDKQKSCGTAQAILQKNEINPEKPKNQTKPRALPQKPF